MATVVGGLGISHTPSMGVEHDAYRRTGEFTPRWQPWFDGTRRLRELLAGLSADHLVVVYNDHLNHFDLDNLPTIAIGIGDTFPQADEGWGRRPLPDLDGDPEWGIHLAESLVASEFDLTICHDLHVDHGIYSWLPYVMDVPWPTPITPIAVNMVRAPLPTANRIRQLGVAIRSAVESASRAERVVVVATGGMSHQISGGRFGIANEGLDRWFLDRLPDGLEDLMKIPVTEYMRVGGTEAAELSLWFAMRAALSASATAAYRFQTFPFITGCGALLMVEP
ncbi:protocatechuate 3,4-dioxygenase [Desertimonas flava]|uniref:DODA-type extradiol aromatic ring-opening family dioxygenase n=1 Tax=Desertimonas flava TaxID=2064846 RepID=UPI000E34BE52|nr:protocatechuate 3,4-dioxygenase [Desertimonas flava]